MTSIKQPETEMEFKDYYDLRWQILREPWQQPKGSEKDELEEQSFHIMACDENDHIIGVGRLHFNDKVEAQVRYMAVTPRHENKDIGSLILDALEKHAKENNRETIVLDARENAVGFYQKKGYKLLEKSHLLFDSIQHYKMKKFI